jgi:hypothetical protein
VRVADPSQREAEATQPQDDFVALFAWVFGYEKTQARAPAYPGTTGGPVRISVPVHGATTLKLGLQRHLMKLAGIGKSDL